MNPQPSQPEEFATFVADDTRQWREVVTAASIKIE